MRRLAEGTELQPWCGPAPSPSAFLTSWNFHPLQFVAFALLFVIGWQWARDRRVYLAAWAALTVAFISPLCALTTALFSARALHHLILTSLAAPLLAYALPMRILPPPIAVVLAAVALVMWHVPAAYSAAWSSDAVYWAMQLALFLPIWGFWSGLIGPQSKDAGTLISQAMLLGFFVAVMGLIGAVLTFSSQLIYFEHHAAPLAWGIEPLADQQLAGLVMWVPGLLPLAVIAALIARRAWRVGQAA